MEGSFMDIFLLCLCCSCPSIAERSFSVDYGNNTFLKDGKPFRYISGCMHYFRVPSVYWRGRLEKMKAGGLDAIETYIPWNFHSTDSGYIFDGQHNISAFLDLVHEVGLLAIVRGFPYSDTEWDMGGLPSWLLKAKYNPPGNPIVLRTADERFLTAVEEWLDVIMPILRPHLYNNGGSVIMVQIENEYGSYYAHDNTYLKTLFLEISKRLDKNVVLFTTDGNGDSDLSHGHIEGVLQTVDFGPTSNATSSFKLLRKYQANGPLVNSEFYTGWLDHWGEKSHHRTSSDVICNTFDEMLAAGASVNFYMFTGGTNSGYWSGSNGPPISQITTSYDYDSPISENGDTTDKYFRIREVIAKYKDLPPMTIPPNITSYAYGKVMLSNRGTFWDHLETLSYSGPISNDSPLSFEDLGTFGGYVLYKAIVPPLNSSDSSQTSLKFENSIRDYAVVFVNQSFVGHVHRGDTHFHLGRCRAGDEINILVESKGRLCYGTGIHDSKGMNGKVELVVDLSSSHLITNWKMYPLNLESMPFSLPTPSKTQSDYLPDTPMVYTGEMYLPTVADTFIDFSGGNWTSGYIIVNGVNIGKFSPKDGPQQTLYMPTKSFLHIIPVINIVVFETSPAKACAELGTSCPISLVDRPNLG